MILRRKKIKLEQSNQTARQFSTRVLKHMRKNQVDQLRALQANAALLQVAFNKEQADFNLGRLSEDRVIWPDVVVKAVANY